MQNTTSEDYKCKKCGIKIDSIKYISQELGELCSNCFKILTDEAADKFINENPCPLKVIGYKEIVDMACSPEAQEAKMERDGTIYYYSEPRTVCKLMPFNKHLDTCIGERKCPIYNGGMR